MKKTLLTFLFLLLASQAWGATATRYVKTTCTNGITTYTPTTQACTGGSDTVYSTVANGIAASNAGDTLLLADGTYTGATNMIAPVSGKSGSSGSPITIGAQTDGAVFINGQDARQPIDLDNNDWLIIEGVNAANSNSSVVNASNGSTNNIFRRIVAWNAAEGNNVVFGIHDADNTLEDVAGFGRGRKTFSFSGSDSGGIIRRAWGKWECYNTDGPKMVYSLVYNSRTTIFENVIGTWGEDSSCQTVTVDQPYGILAMDRLDAAPWESTSKFLGSIAYLNSTDTLSSGWGNQGALRFDRTVDDVEAKDIVIYNPPGTHASLRAIRSQIFDEGAGGVSDCATTADGVCTRLLTNISSIGWGTVNDIDSATTISNNVQVYANVAAAPNVWNGAGTSGARVCYRYQDGTLTANPLWSWPMQKRIVDAMTTAGKTPIDINTTMEGIFGAPPLACQRLKPASADTTSDTVVRVLITTDQSPAKNPDVTKFTLTQSGVSLPLVSAAIAGTNIIDITTSGTITVGTSLALSGTAGAFQDNYGNGSMSFTGFGVTNNVTAGTTDVFVDNANSCTGDAGTDAEPWCSIAAAFLHPGLGSGSVIKIRTGTGTYTESTATLNVSGSAGNPIIIQPDTAAAFVIRSATASGDGSTTAAAIRIRSSHVTVTGLTFDGAGVYTARYGLLVDNNAADIDGITITGNTFQNWGGTGAATLLGPTALRLNGDYTNSRRINAPQITNNTFTDNAHEDIRTTYAFNGVISGNTSTGVKCGKYQDWPSRMGTQSIKIAGGVSPATSSGMQIIGNSVSAPNLDCSAVPASAAEEKHNGLYCDTGVTDAIYENNFISGTWGGIFVESRCDRNIVRNNVIEDLAGSDTGDSFGIKVDAVDATVINNTVGNCTIECLFLRDGARATVKNNIFVSDGTRVVRVHPDAVTDGGHTIDSNLYFNTANANAIGSWNNTTVDTLAQWKTDCACDTSTAAADPAFTSYAGDDFTLTASSTAAINMGAAVSGVGCNNPACDRGAYEKIEIGSINVGANGVNKIMLTLENNRYTNLLASNPLTGFTARKGGADNSVTAASISGNTVTLTTKTDYAAGDACDVTYDSAAGNITDSAPFANKQKLLSFSQQPCANTVTAGSGTLALNALTSGEDATDRSAAYTTASVTITQDRLALLAIHGRLATDGNVSDPTIGGTLSATWAQVGGTNYGTDISNRAKLWIFCTKVAADQTGTITITPNGETWAHTAWSLAEFSGVIAGGVCSDDIGQAVFANKEAEAAGTSFTVNLGSFSLAENRPYMACASRILAADDHVPDTGWTQIHEVDVTGEVNTLFTEWHATAQDLMPSVSWTTSDNDIGCGAIEIKASSGAAPTTRPTGANISLLGIGK